MKKPFGKCLVLSAFGRVLAKKHLEDALQRQENVISSAKDC